MESYTSLSKRSSNIELGHQGFTSRIARDPIEGSTPFPHSAHYGYFNVTVSLFVSSVKITRNTARALKQADLTIYDT